MDDCHLFLQDLLILDSSEVHHVFGLLSVLCDGNFGWFALLDLGDFADNIRNDVSRGCILDSTLDIGSNGNDMVGDSLDSLGLHFFGFCKQTLFDHVVLTSRGAAHEESVNVLVDIKHQGSTQEISDLADLLGNWLKTTVTAVLGNDTGNRGLHVKSRSRRSCFWNDVLHCHGGFFGETELSEELEFWLVANKGGSESEGEDACAELI